MTFSEFIRCPDYEGWQLHISERSWGYNLASTFEQAVMMIGWHRAGCMLEVRLLCGDDEHGSARWQVLPDGRLRVRRVAGACQGLADQYNRSMCTLGRSYPISIASLSQGGTNETNRIYPDRRRARGRAHRRACRF